jgi:hypothetical protein
MIKGLQQSVIGYLPAAVHQDLPSQRRTLLRSSPSLVHELIGASIWLLSIHAVEQLDERPDGWRFASNAGATGCCASRSPLLASRARSFVALKLTLPFGEPLRSKGGEVGNVTDIAVGAASTVALPERERDSFELHPRWRMVGGVRAADCPHVDRQAGVGLQEATTAERRLGHHRVRTVPAYKLNDLLVTHANLDRLSHLRLVEHQLQGLADHSAWTLLPARRTSPAPPRRPLGKSVGKLRCPVRDP